MGSCLSTFYINYNNNKKLVNASIKNAPLFSLDGLYTKCKIIDIYDGDTVTIALIINNEVKSFKCRLFGIDTPELKGNTHELGIRARNKCIEYITHGKVVLSSNIHYTRENIREICETNLTLINVKCGPFEKYGRLLVTLYTIDNKVSINDQLVNNGFAKPYFGKTKEKFLI